jgi:hypothetical protein
MGGSDISDPVKIGPGSWGVIHSLARKNTSEEGQLFAKQAIEDIIRTFPCLECRGHAMEYLAKHPIPTRESDEGDKDQFLVFSWTVDFHNFVNKRLHKDYIDLQDALKLWSGENICLEDCGGEPIEIDVKDLKKDRQGVYKVF